MAIKIPGELSKKEPEDYENNVKVLEHYYPGLLFRVNVRKSAYAPDTRISSQRV